MTFGRLFLGFFVVLVVPVVVSYGVVGMLGPGPTLQWSWYPDAILVGGYIVFAALLSFYVARLWTESVLRWVRDVEMRRDGGGRSVIAPLIAPLARVRSGYEAMLVDERERALEVKATAAAVVHDLRAPIVGLRNVVRHMSEGAVLRRRGDDGLLVELATTTEELVRQVSDAVKEIRALATDVADRSDLLSLRSIVERARSNVDRVDCSIEIQGDATVLCDGDLMSRALTNLIENAARVARSTVWVEIHTGLVRIADDGPGLPRPFDELVRPFASGGPGRGASGLGLATTARVLRAHGGRLKLERSDGRGTVLLAYVGSGLGVREE